MKHIYEALIHQEAPQRQLSNFHREDFFTPDAFLIQPQRESPPGIKPRMFPLFGECGATVNCIYTKPLFKSLYKLNLDKRHQESNQ